MTNFLSLSQPTEVGINKECADAEKCCFFSILFQLSLNGNWTSVNI